METQTDEQMPAYIDMANVDEDQSHNQTDKSSSAHQQAIRASNLSNSLNADLFSLDPKVAKRGSKTMLYSKKNSSDEITMGENSQQMEKSLKSGSKHSQEKSISVARISAEKAIFQQQSQIESAGFEQESSSYLQA